MEGGASIRDLSLLVGIGCVLRSARNLEDLERQLMNYIMDIVPAERGAIMLSGERSGEFTSIVGCDKRTECDREVQISRTVIDRALRERAPVLSEDTGMDGVPGD